jgi:hypothetical protein
MGPLALSAALVEFKCITAMAKQTVLTVLPSPPTMMSNGEYGACAAEALSDQPGPTS